MVKTYNYIEVKKETERPWGMDSLKKKNQRINKNREKKN